MQIPAQEHQDSIEVKKSRFHGALSHIVSAEDALTLIGKARLQYPAANHHCWAYRLQQENRLLAKYSDEGEPSGTAGKPILESLEEKEIVDAVLIVSRIFGGTKLGMGGLSRAYRRCARLVIAGASFIEKVESCLLRITFFYPHESKMRCILTNLGGTIASAQYSEKITWEVNIPRHLKEEYEAQCRDICSGDVTIKCLDNKVKLPSERSL